MPSDERAEGSAKMQGGRFDQFVLDTAHGIFADTLGRDVADVLRHNFLTREPLLANPNVDRSAVLQRILAESFGDFHLTIMDIITEQVCKGLGIDQTRRDPGESQSLLASARKAYCASHNPGSGVA